MRFSWLPKLVALSNVVCAACAWGQYLPDSPPQSVPAQPYALSAPADTLPEGPTPLPPTDFSATSLTASSNASGETWLGTGYGRPLGSTDLLAQCDPSPKRGMVLFVSYDSWKGIQDGGWQNNGIAAGVNFGTRLGQFSDWTGIGFQIGGSAADYNWSGTDYRFTHADQSQPQGFITYGAFRKPNEDSNWSAALVQDWMLNANFGAFGQNPTLSQWRGQLGYATSAWNEFGIWGTWRGHGDTRDVGPPFGQVSWRAVNQLSFFVHHKWSLGGADTALWVGVPEHDRLAGGGSLGDYLIGLSGNVPLNDRVSLYTLLTYMHPSAPPGEAGFDEEAWNFTVGMSFYPGRNARSNTVAGQCWLPMLPVANNGLFLVDSNQTY